MKRKSECFCLKLIGVPYEKGWKITKNATCVYEEEDVHMKGKSACFCLKLIGVPYEKGWKITKNATCVFEGEDLP